MNEIDLLKSAVATRTADVPFSPTPEAVLQGVARRRRRIAVSTAAASVVLVAGGVAVAVSSQGGAHAVPPAVSATEQPHSQDEARVKAEQELTQIALPSGATPTDTPPVDGLQPRYSPGDPMGHALGYWTAPGTMAETQSFFERTEELGNRSSGGGAAGIPQVNQLFYGSWGQTVVAFAAVDDDTVGIRVDIAESWSTARPADEVAPDDVTSVDVQYVRGSEKGKVVTVTGDDASHLVEVFNGLTTPPMMAAHSCPADDGLTATLTFHSPSHEVVAVDTLRGCGYVSVRIDGTERPVLESSGLYDEVVSLLGDPPSIGTPLS